MEKAKRIFFKLLYPPHWVLFTVPVVSYSALIYIFVSQKTESVPAYIVYCLSAYSLAILSVSAPRICRQLKAAVKNNRAVRKTHRSANGNDSTFFKEWGQLQKADEYAHRRDSVFHRYSYCSIYAASQPKNQSRGWLS